MIAIRAEIDKVGGGEWPTGDNPLRERAAHRRDGDRDEWPHAYPRRVAAYPSGQPAGGKYWSPVRRIDGAYGDRNLVCACPPPEAFA